MKSIVYLGIGLSVLIALPVWAADTDKIAPSADMEITARLAYDDFRHSLVEIGSLPADYADFKKDLNSLTGLSYALTASFLPQRGSPNGKGTAWQSKYHGVARWDLMQSDTYGDLSAQIAYNLVHYWGKSARDIDRRIGVVSPMNENPANGHAFKNLSVTYALPERYWKTALTIGQYDMGDFDGTPYTGNEQLTFINYALADNASAAYSGAGLGAYMTMHPHADWTLAAGLQNAYNTSDEAIHLRHLGKKKYATFASASYTPTIPQWGSGEYTVLVYYQPAVPAQAANSIGWSLNAMQHFGRLGLFASVNGANESTQSVKQSYVLGGVYHNPLNRNALDQIGLAIAVNKLNKETADTRSVENVLEAYWAWGISNFMTLTPDIQFYMNPGKNRQVHTATVASLRATVMF